MFGKFLNRVSNKADNQPRPAVEKNLPAEPKEKYIPIDNALDFCPFDKLDSCAIVNRLKQDLRDIQRLTKTGDWKLNLQTNDLEWSEETYDIFERNRKFPVTFNTFMSFVHDLDRVKVRTVIENAIKNCTGFDIEFRIITTLGNEKWVRSISDLSKSDREYAIGTIQDISKRKATEASLIRMSTVFLSSTEASIITSRDGIILEVNDSFTKITGYAKEDVIGKTPSILKSGIQNEDFYKSLWTKILNDGQWSGEIWNKRKNGEIYPEHLKIIAVRDEMGEITNFVSLFSDISMSKKHIEEMQHLAYHDALTGLPNRTKFSSHIESAIEISNKSGKSFVVAYLDLDNFKPINDIHGHTAGDDLLKAVAHRLNKCIRNNDIVARFGGDEFVILLMNVNSDHEADVALNRMCTSIAKPFSINGHSISVTASIGLTTYPFDSCDVDALLRHADQALYDAKRQGKNQICRFDPSNEEQYINRKKIKIDLEHALEHGNLCVYWQPYFDLNTNQIIGAEALLRWADGAEIIPPIHFLDFIEHDNLGIAIGDFVIETVFDKVNELNKDLKLDNFHFSINLFQRQLLHVDFEKKVKIVASKYKSKFAHQITFEILETAAIEDFDYVNTLISSMNKIGYNFAIDDFGTGYSSLTYFSKIKAGIIKIDKSFISNITTNAADTAVISSLIDLSAKFNKIIIAEGVETNEQRHKLIELGCNIAQGYLFSRPIQFEEFKNLLVLQSKINK